MSQWWPEPYCDPAAEDEARHLAGVDADLELAGMNAVADALYAAEARGVCVHWSVQGYTRGPRSEAQQGLRPGQSRCTNRKCWRVFASDDEWQAAQAAIAEGDD
jgi:hypothetical protein